jgi:integrase/recombinase XerD
MADRTRPDSQAPGPNEQPVEQAPPGRIGSLSEAEVRELYGRRRISAKTSTMYLGYLRKADLFCRSQGTYLDELDEDGLFAFACTLHPSRSVLHQARAALRHYWAGTGRPCPPQLSVLELLGRAGRDPSEGVAARERLGAPRVPKDGWGVSTRPPRWLMDGLRSRQLSKKTATVHVQYLRRCARWCVEHGTTIDTVSPSELEAWAESLPRTRSSLMVVRSSLNHYYALTRRPDPPTYMIRVPRRKRMISKALSEADARTLERAAIERKDRWGLAVIIGLYLGLRRFEIAKLRWSDFKDGWVTLVGKGDLEATLPVHQVVQDYLALVKAGEGRGPDRSAANRHSSEFVFPGRWEGSVNPTTLWGWVRQVAVEAGLKEVPTHVLRHTALAMGNDVTGDLRAVQDFARHADPNTTAGYTRTTRRGLERVMQAIAEGYRPETEAIDLGPEADGPTLPFSQLIATVDGAHAVAPWRELAQVLGSRPGWRLVGSMEGEGIVRFEYSPLLSASVIAFMNDRAPTFDLSLVVGPSEEDIDVWRFDSADELGRLLEDLERGLPVEPADTEFRIAPDGRGFWYTLTP